ncbi:MAG: hypothetical protein NXI00_10980 [Cytophagales bacterium]|nr:hypothetical protein [Cytophagales bacterium]
MCTPIVLESANYCDQLEQEQAGLGEIISIFNHSDVETYPAYSTVAAGELTASAALVTAAAAITMKAAKFPSKLHCIMEENSLQVKKNGKRSWMTELKVRVQNTTHNAGVIHQLCKTRFSVAVPQVEGGLKLLGQSDGVSVGFLCEIADDGVLEEFGKQYQDDKYIDVTIVCDPKHPVDYPFAIAYS